MNVFHTSLLVRLMVCHNITSEERSLIMRALNDSEDNKKRVGYWIQHKCENYTTYVCSNCGNMLIPEKMPGSDSPFTPCKYKDIYISAYRYCYICGYKMEGVKNFTHLKEWLEKFD